MPSNRIKAIKNHNIDLLMTYLENYNEINQMHGAYKNYTSMILGWAGDRDILKAPEFRLTFAEYLKEKSSQSGKQYAENYVYSACLFARDFFRYCKSVLPEEDTEILSDFWVKNIVPGRSSAKRLSFNWLTEENLVSIMELKTDQERLRRAQAAILLASITGMTRVSLLSIPIKEIDFSNLLVYQYPERGVYTEKSASGTTHIFPDYRIIDFLNDYRNKLLNVVPDESTWYVRLSRHGIPQPVKFGPITPENQKDAYLFAIAPYGKLKEDLSTISRLCKIPQITMTIVQNTFIFRRLKCGASQNDICCITQDLLLRSDRAVKQCLKYLQG